MIPETRRRVTVLALIVLMWSWPSAVFLPPILGQTNFGLFMVSLAIAISMGALITTISFRLLAVASTKNLALVTIASVGIAVVGVIIYLTAVSAGIVGGLGGDRGDALDVGLSRLLQGEYPYSELTSWGGKITPLPGSFILALPAHLAAHSGFATVYLVPLAAFILWKTDKRTAAIANLALVSSPVYWADVLSSGDLVVSAFLLFAVALATFKAAKSPGSARWLWAVALGLVATTRVTGIVTVFVLTAVGVGSGRSRVAFRQLAVSLLVIIGLSLPFYLLNPAEFSPLHTSSFARGPFGISLVVIAILITMWASVTSPHLRKLPDPAKLMWAFVPLTIFITTVPLILDPSITTLYLSTYAVMAVIAPVGILGVTQRQTMDFERTNV